MTTTHLPVMEHFYTLQGEGYYAGQAAYFIRLAGCDVGCHWCDVKESWEAHLHSKLSIDELVNFVKNTPVALVVITGGEPTMHDLSALTSALKTENIKVHLETSGAHKIIGTLDWITLSPKKFKPPLPENCQLANELKIIIFNRSDFDWATQYAQLVNKNCLLYLQPEWDQKEKVTPLIIDFLLKNPNWRLSLQTHKYINIP